ncbi:MAG: slipin family protein [Chloroflexi bacterium]|nr:slipin family protein [Chloroflexota bacterium]
MEGVILVFVVVVVAIVVLASLRQCAEWERKVVLRLGRFAGVRGPGVFFLLPFIEQTPFTVDLRTVTSAFTAEQTLTRDNVPVNVDTIIYWRVIDPARAVLQVEDYRLAVLGAAQTALRDIIGRSNLSRVLAERTAIDEELTHVLDAQTEPWGVKVTAVLMRDIKIPDALQDAMSRVAQAERERDARVILGQSETLIAQQFAEAGEVYANNPMALHLRGMNMLYETMRQNPGSIVIIPASAVESMALGGMTGITALAQNVSQGESPPAAS